MSISKMHYVGRTVLSSFSPDTLGGLVLKNGIIIPNDEIAIATVHAEAWNQRVRGEPRATTGSGKMNAASAAEKAAPPRRDHFPRVALHGKDAHLSPNCPRGYSWDMNNKKNEGKISGEKNGANEVRKLVFFGAASLKLGREILERLESIDISIGILAAQKERELNPEATPSSDPEPK